MPQGYIEIEITNEENITLIAMIIRLVVRKRAQEEIGSKSVRILLHLNEPHHSSTISTISTVQITPFRPNHTIIV